MKIKYLTNVRIPTSRAQGYAIMKMCSEFAKAGAVVELFIPSRRSDAETTGGDPFEYYNIPKNFTIKKVLSSDLLSTTFKFGKLFYWIDMILFLIAAPFSVHVKKGDVLYTRDFLTLLLFPKRVFSVLEVHDIPESTFLFKYLIRKPKLFFVLNKNVQQALVTLGVSESKIHLAPSGIEVADFDISLDKNEARKRLNVPIDKKIVLYSGQFYGWKGVDILAQTAAHMPETLFVFVGGTEPQFTPFEKKYGQSENILVYPYQERAMVPIYLKAADVLVVPNSKSNAISTYYTSPLKIFEYMAARRPIVVSDLPSTREAIRAESALFVESDNPEALAAALRKILSEKELSERFVANAFTDVQKYTWKKRAEDILSVVQHENK